MLEMREEREREIKKDVEDTNEYKWEDLRMLKIIKLI